MVYFIAVTIATVLLVVLTFLFIGKAIARKMTHTIELRIEFLKIVKIIFKYKRKR